MPDIVENTSRKGAGQWIKYGRILKLRRETLPLPPQDKTQIGFARRAGVHQALLSRIERGWEALPRYGWEWFERVAPAYGWTPEEMLAALDIRHVKRGDRHAPDERGLVDARLVLDSGTFDGESARLGSGIEPAQAVQMPVYSVRALGRFDGGTGAMMTDDHRMIKASEYRRGLELYVVDLDEFDDPEVQRASNIQRGDLLFVDTLAFDITAGHVYLVVNEARPMVARARLIGNTVWLFNVADDAVAIKASEVSVIGRIDELSRRHKPV